MIWNQEIRDFIAKHINDDTDSLLLGAKRYPGIDVPAAVDQIEARRRLKTKLPEWYAVSDNLIMGGRVPAEQCSSESTAKYKRALVFGDSLCDLTGGMGVDFYYMSRGLSSAIYTERQHHLCEAAEHNFKVLGADNVIIREGDGRELPIPDVDTIYLDPARRAEDGNRVYEIADCEPNIVELQDELLKHCRHLVTKVSPMVDIPRTLTRLHSVTDIHVVAVKGECKEVLIEQGERRSEACVGDVSGGADVVVHCVDFLSNSTIEFHYSLDEEHSASAVYSVDGVGVYLYEPDVTLMKSHAFRLLCSRLGVEKLDPDVHLYTSNTYVSNFPGRRFVVDDVMEFSSKLLKTLKRRVPKANITSRGFVLTADELRGRAGIKDGGDIYLFATTVNGKKVIVKCSKA
jgi:16S rRNA G966 N2-methylase RsmD